MVGMRSLSQLGTSDTSMSERNPELQRGVESTLEPTRRQRTREAFSLPGSRSATKCTCSHGHLLVQLQQNATSAATSFSSLLCIPMQALEPLRAWGICPLVGLLPSHFTLGSQDRFLELQLEAGLALRAEIDPCMPVEVLSRSQILAQSSRGRTWLGVCASVSLIRWWATAVSAWENLPAASPPPSM